MANAFDQFDTVPQVTLPPVVTGSKNASRASNPFDQFDAPIRKNVSAEPNRTLAGFAGNVVKSGGQFAGGIVQSIAHPVDTVKGMAELATGALLQAAPKEVVDWFNQYGDKEKVKRVMDMAKAVGGQYAKDYGSIEGFKNKVYTDPVGVAADLSTILSAGATVAGKANLPNVASKLSTASTYTNPLSVLNVPVTPGSQTTVAQVPGKMAGRVVNFLSNVANPKAATVLATTEGRAPEIVNALRQPLREFTPGYQPTAAEVVTDLNLTKLPAAQAEWSRQATTPYYQRGAEQNAALLAPLKVEPTTLNMAEARRAAVTSPMYKQATAPTAPVDLRPAVNVIDDLITKNEGASSITSLLHSIKDNLYKETPSVFAGQKPTKQLATNAQQAANAMDEIKILIGKEKDPHITKQLMAAKDAIENAIPGYAQAQETFAKLSKPINQGEIATYLRNKLKSNLEAEAKLTPSQFAGALENIPGTVKNATGLTRVEDLSAVLEPEQIKILNQIKEDIANKAKMEQQAKAGGKGFSALEAGQIPKAPHVFSKLVSITNDVISRLQGKIDRKMAMELAMDMLDPAKAADTVEKAWARQQNIEYMKQLANEGAKKVGKVAASKENVAIGQVQNALSKGQQEQNQNALAK